MVLKIGPIEVDPPVVLAPMAGVTNAAFRTLCRSYGAGLYVSEMVSARALIQGNATTRRMVQFGSDETVRSLQLYAVDPRVVAEAIRVMVDEVGVDHIDLNMGCPSPKVTRRGGGAALPVHRVLFGSIVAAAVRAAGVELLGGARVQGDRGGARVLGCAAGVEVGEDRVVDALAHLHGDRHGPGGAHSGGNDRAEQHPVHGQCCAAASPGHLR